MSIATMMPDFLVASPGPGEPAPWAGIWIAEDVDQIVSAVQSGSWIDGTLGIAGAGLDALALVSDPVGGLLQYGVAWLIEHVRPLSEALDWLAGDPDQVSAHARTWRNVAASLQDRAADLARVVRWDTVEWTGSAGDAYRGHAGREEQRLLILARASEGMAFATESAGMLIGTVRLMVRDAVATVVSRLVVYAGELTATAGLAAPFVVEQVTTLCASWAARIARWLKSLIRSLSRLGEATRQLGDLLEPLRRDRGTGRRDAQPQRPAGGQDPMFSKSPVRSNQDVLDHGPPMTLDNVTASARRMGIDLDDVGVSSSPTPRRSAISITWTPGRTPPPNSAARRSGWGPRASPTRRAWRLRSRTSNTHVRQQRDGEHLRTPLRELEDRAYESEGPALDRYRRGRA